VSALPRNGLVRLFFLIVLLALGFGVAVEQQFGEQLAKVNTTPPPRDPEGRKLYILMVDSLSVEDAARMPHFTGVGEQGFRMEMQPCFDNFTTACVREMLTGRRMFSLFSVLENLQVTRPGVGENLIADAKQAGLSTALLSWGDLRAWSNLVDTNIRLKGKQRNQEAEIGLKAANSHDLVFHHWIWHDVASHHHAKKNGPKYAESLERTDELIQAIAAGLPEDMDLIVTGDHGHAPDGRHVQGMDVPTVLVARTPNLKTMTAKGRPPITASRYVMGAITGVGSHASQVETPWRSWLSTDIGSDLRNIGTERTSSTSSSLFPKGPVIAVTLLALVSLGAMGWKIGAAVFLWMLFAGFYFPDWLEFSHVRGFRKPIMALAWCFPILGAIWGAVRGKNLSHIWLGSTFGGVALALALWPGFFVTGVLRNTTTMLTPIAFISGLIVLKAVFENRKTQHKKFQVLTVVTCVTAVVLAVILTDFNTNHFRIRRFPALWALQDHQDLKIIASMALGTVTHRLLDNDSRWSILGAIAVPLGAMLSIYFAAAAFLGILAALFMRTGPWRNRTLSFLCVLVTGHTLTENRQLGVLLTVAGIGITLQVIQWATERSTHKSSLPAARWSVAIMLFLAAFIGLAWTTKLQVSGVDFTFAVDWLPGRLHKELWWIVAAATVVNCFLPLLLTFEIARSKLGHIATDAAAIAARFSALRFTATTVFATGWMISMGATAASARLRSLLQDGFIWLLIGIFLALLSRCSSKTQHDQRVVTATNA
jgi:hypothetical protein